MSLFTSLRYLVALHQHQHFGRAAAACNITQPALSNAIRALEEEYGTAIVKRGRAFECFTPEGERIFQSAQRVLHEQDLLRQDLDSTASHPVGTLTLGAVPSVMPIAARLVGMLHARHPGLSIVLRSMSSPDIEAGLEDLSVDVALGYTDRLKSRARRIEVIDQYVERYFLLRRGDKAGQGASGLRVASAPVSWHSAAQLPLCLLTPEMHNRTIVNAALAAAGVAVTPAIETNSIMALGLTVLVGEVCSILPGALVGSFAGQSGLEALPLCAPEVLTPIGLMFASTDRPAHALRAMLELATDPAWQAHVAAHSGLLPSLAQQDGAPARD